MISKNVVEEIKKMNLQKYFNTQPVSGNFRALHFLRHEMHHNIFMSYPSFPFSTYRKKIPFASKFTQEKNFDLMLNKNFLGYKKSINPTLPFR